MIALVRIIVRLSLRLLFRVRLTGEMEAHERLLMVSNHQSFLDGIILGAFLPVMPVWLVHTTIARRWYVRFPIRLLPHLVVDTSNPFAMKAAVGLIEAGKPVLIFPEGRITVTGAMMKIYDGPAFVAARTGAQLVPVHIDGAVYTVFGRMSGDFPRRLFPRINVTIGQPRSIPMPQGRTARLRRRLAAERLRRIMQEAAFASRPRTTLFPALLEAVRLHGRGRRVLEDIRQREESYGQILKASLALGRLVSRLASEGEHIGILMPNLSTTVSLFFGAVAMRRVPAFLNYTAGAEGMQSACRLADIRVVLTSRAFLDKARLGHVVERLREVRIVYLEDLRAEFGWKDKLWLLGWALWFPGRAARPARPDAPAAVLFTSGSEGKPKGVVLSHDSILANVEQLRAVIDFTSKDKFLSVLPLFHAFGLTVGAITPLLTGCRVFVYPSPLHYRRIPETAYDRDSTVLFATNTFLANYGKQAHPYDFRSIRILGAGAEKLGEDVRQLYAEKFGLRIIEGYGATECSPVISMNTPLSFRSGTVGEVLPGMECRLEPVPGIEQGGLLHVRGANMMLGYLRPERPGTVEPTASLFGPGWYNTGDIVTMEDGFVRIVGRMKRFAKVAGEMVSLEAVEKIATAASPQFDHASAALPQPGRGEVIVLFTEDPGLRRESLQRAARDLGAPELALPRRIVHVPKMPLLGNGKKDYVTINQMARSVVMEPARSG
jgi:acyl-[acyl-carrier-protein]-phospholipid O-acyltransferase/long-chain-fatty-acid--[acyl-carrier-protein] ligase